MPDEDLKIALGAAVGRLYRRLRAERGVDELSDTQHGVLAQIARLGPCTPTQLCEHARVTAPSMNQAVTGLVDAGLVTREPDPDDGRKVRIVPTESGLEIAAEARRRRHVWLQSRLDTLTPAQRATLADAAAILLDVADS